MYNPELFYDYQLDNPSLTWGLITRGTEILYGILDESDYSFGVSHQYSGAVDPTGLVNKVKDKANSILDMDRFLKGAFNVSGIKTLAKGANTFVDGASKTLKETFPDIKDNGAFDKGVKSIKNMFNKLSNSTDSRFFNALDYIQTFQGTKIDFRFPELRTTILSGVNAGPSELSVSQRIGILNDYFIGDTQSFVKVFGLQSPPNKYSPRFTGLSGSDVQFQGSFSLRLGTQQIIKNLIITDYYVNLSKIKRSAPEGSMLDGDYLYADVTISVAPAAYVTKAMLNRYYGLKSPR